MYVYRIQGIHLTLFLHFDSTEPCGQWARAFSAVSCKEKQITLESCHLLEVVPKTESRAKSWSRAKHVEVVPKSCSRSKKGEAVANTSSRAI